MKKKYNVTITDLLNSTYRVDGWEVTDWTDDSNVFSDWAAESGYSFGGDNLWQSAKYQEETPEEKTARELKEKATKRNNKIDQILGDND